MADDVILVVQDQWDRTIHMTAPVWVEHICEFHRELIDGLDAIEKTLVSPDLVRYDASRPDGECFYKMGAVPAIPQRLLKVAVRFPNDGDDGFVHTAYVSRNIPARERPKWQRQ